MKTTSAAFILLLFSSAVSSPIYKTQVVTFTSYTTITAGYEEYTSAHPLISPSTSEIMSEVTSASTSSTVTPETTELPTATVSSSTANTLATASDKSSSVSKTSSIETSAASSGTIFSGQGTYYSTGLGACGWTNVDTDYIVALSHDLFDQYTSDGNPNDNTLCGKKIVAYYESNSVEVTVVDRCEGCSYYDLDFSPSAFSQLADQSLGRIDITWEWV